MGVVAVTRPVHTRGQGALRPVAGEKTLEALIAHRYEVMAGYARHMREVFAQQIVAADSTRSLRLARRWLHRAADRVPAAAVPQRRRKRHRGARG